MLHIRVKVKCDKDWQTILYFPLKQAKRKNWSTVFAPKTILWSRRPPSHFTSTAVLSRWLLCVLRVITLLVWRQAKICLSRALKTITMNNTFHDFCSLTSDNYSKLICGKNISELYSWIQITRTISKDLVWTSQWRVECPRLTVDACSPEICTFCRPCTPLDSGMPNRTSPSTRDRHRRLSATPLPPCPETSVRWLSVKTARPPHHGRCRVKKGDLGSPDGGGPGGRWFPMRVEAGGSLERRHEQDSTWPPEKVFECVCCADDSYCCKLVDLCKFSAQGDNWPNKTENGIRYSTSIIMRAPSEYVTPVQNSSDCTLVTSFCPFGLMPLMAPIFPPSNGSTQCLCIDCKAFFTFSLWKTWMVKWTLFLHKNLHLDCTGLHLQCYRTFQKTTNLISIKWDSPHCLVHEMPSETSDQPADLT